MPIHFSEKNPKCTSGHLECSFEIENTSLKPFGWSEKNRESSKNKIFGWRCTFGHVEIIFGNVNQTAEIFSLKTQIKLYKLLDFPKETIKRFLWKSVLRIVVFSKILLSDLRASLTELDDTQVFFQQFLFWPVYDPPSTEVIAMLLRLLFNIFSNKW